MARFAPMIAAVGAITLVTHGIARAASDVTVAAIAAGRLYVVGSTERPRTPVVLDGQFHTESDDKGQFRYALVYHPARCIVSATIDGKAYEAVVSNCGEQCRAAPPGIVGSDSAGPPPVAASQSAPGSEQPGRSPSRERPGSARSSGSPALTPPAAPTPPGAAAPPVAAPDATSALNREARRPDTRGSGVDPIVNPPLPPARPSFRIETRARPPRPARPVTRPKSEPQQDPSEPDALPADALPED